MHLMNMITMVPTFTFHRGSNSWQAGFGGYIHISFISFHFISIHFSFLVPINCNVGLTGIESGNTNIPSMV